MVKKKEENPQPGTPVAGLCPKSNRRWLRCNRVEHRWQQILPFENATWAAEWRAVWTKASVFRPTGERGSENSEKWRGLRQRQVFLVQAPQKPVTVGRKKSTSFLSPTPDWDLVSPPTVSVGSRPQQRRQRPAFASAGSRRCAPVASQMLQISDGGIYALHYLKITVAVRPVTMWYYTMH